MKKYLFMALVTILFAGCAPKTSNPYSTTAFISHDTQGILTLRGVSDEFDNNSKNEGQEVALAHAHKKAIQHLFYMGFPDTDFKNPLIVKGIAVETEKKAFFDEFWATGYKKFITNNAVTYQGCEQKKKCVKAVSTFKLNYNMLRKELEQKKVLNKIGF